MGRALTQPFRFSSQEDAHFGIFLSTRYVPPAITSESPSCYSSTLCLLSLHIYMKYTYLYIYSQENIYTYVCVCIFSCENLDSQNFCDEARVLGTQHLTAPNHKTRLELFPPMAPLAFLTVTIPGCPPETRRGMSRKKIWLRCIGSPEPKGSMRSHPKIGPFYFSVYKGPDVNSFRVIF